MQLKLTIALLAFAVICEASVLPSIVHGANNKIGNYLLKSSMKIEENPTRSIECFNIYIPKLNELTETYEANYGICLKTSENSYAALEEEVSGNRQELETDSGTSCNSFANCNENTAALSFFQCYQTAASEATKIAYNIGNAAGEAVAYMNRQIENIKYDQDRCKNDASKEYVAETSKVYEDLDDCLAGKPIKTTTAPTPTTVPTTTIADSSVSTLETTIPTTDSTLQSTTPIPNDEKSPEEDLF